MFFSDSVYSSDNNTRDLFSIYLVKNCDICSCDPGGYNIDSLNLEPGPFLTLKDLKWYKWKTHEFALKDSSTNPILNKFEQDPMKFEKQFFMVVVNNERIYLGIFWSAFSSTRTCYPYISVPVPFRHINFLARPELKDPRNDHRIFDALKAVGILKE